MARVGVTNTESYIRGVTLLVLGAEFGVEVRLALGEVLLLGVQRGLVLGPGGLGCRK